MALLGPGHGGLLHDRIGIGVLGEHDEVPRLGPDVSRGDREWCVGVAHCVPSLERRSAPMTIASGA